MKKGIKSGLATVVALTLVIGIGVFANDHRLKATDGDENMVTTEAVESTEETEAETVEEAMVESEAVEIGTEVAEETEEAREIIVNDPERQVSVTSNVEAGDSLENGKRVTLTAEISGFDGLEYTYQWQYSADGENWVDVNGANSDKYTFALDDENVNWLWRVLVNVED